MTRIVLVFMATIAPPALSSAQQFLPGVPYTVGHVPDQVIAADLNNDGKLDLAVCDTYENTIAVLPGNGDGTFQRAKYHEIPQPQALAAVDFNGDGILDLAVLQLSGGRRGVPILCVETRCCRCVRF